MDYDFLRGGLHHQVYLDNSWYTCLLEERAETGRVVNILDSVSAMSNLWYKYRNMRMEDIVVRIGIGVGTMGSYECWGLE